MIRWLASIRLTRPQLAAVAIASAVATTLVIADSTPGRTGLQLAAIAALQRRAVIHKVGAATGSSDPSASSDPGASSPSPTSQAPSPASHSSGSSGSSAAGASSGSSAQDTGQATTTQAATTKTSKVKHVFVIALSTTNYAAAFGRGSVARYLNGTLVRRGTLLSGYQTLGHSELSDYLAMVSGQAPNPDTSANCPEYAEFPSGAKPDGAGEVPGNGCIYPVTALTIGDQVTGSGHVWNAFVDDMGSTTCVHPNSGALDDAQLPGAGSQYDTRHNPFIYFHSLLDLGDCSNDDEALTQLPADLRSASKTPSYAYIAPGLCDDSSQVSCPDGKPGGLAAEDAFLSAWVPQILRSPAYKQDGVLIVVFATSEPSGSSTGSDSPARAGALVLSRYAKAGRTISTAYDPYSLLRSVGDLFGFAPLAHAKAASSFVAAALPGAA